MDRSYWGLQIRRKLCRKKTRFAAAPRWCDHQAGCEVIQHGDDPYLSFNWQCQNAFRFYQRCLGGQLGPMFRYAGSPMAEDVPADWQDKVMHGSLTLADQMLMGADVAPDRYQEPKGFSLSLQITSTAEAERVFDELAEGGRIVLPLEKTFWAAPFGMLVDRFGIPWMVNCEGEEQAAEG